MQKEIFVSIEDVFQMLRDGHNHQGVSLLYQYHYKTMYGIAFSVLKGHNDCQDVVHNVMSKLLCLDASKFPNHHVLSWLYTVTKNEALMFMRSIPDLGRSDEMHALIEEDKNIQDLVDMDNFHAMIRGLNNIQKQVVTLKVLGGCTHREIAEMLGKPIGTIQWIYNSAIKKLKIIHSGLFVLMVVMWTKCMSKIVVYVWPRISPDVSVNETFSGIEREIIFYGISAVLLSLVYFIFIKKKRCNLYK